MMHKINFTIIVILLNTVLPIHTNELLNNNIDDGQVISKKINFAKLLRNDLFEHIKVVEKLINDLDLYIFEEIKNFTNSENITEFKLTSVENQTNILHQNIVDLSQEIIDKDVKDVTIFTEKLNLINNNFTALNCSIDGETNLGLKLLTEYSNRFNILETLSDLNNEILETSEKIDDKYMSIIAGECAKFIVNTNYLAAEKKLNEIDDEKIDYIAKSIFKIEMDSENFDKTLYFGKQINNITKTFLIYKSLKGELDNYNYTKDFVKNSIDLIQFTNSEIMYFVYTPKIIKIEANSLIESLETNIVYNCVNRLQGYMMLPLEFSTDIDLDFMKNIFKYDIKIFDSVIELFTNLNINSDNSYYLNNNAHNKMLMKIFNMLMSQLEMNYKLKMAYYMEKLLNKSSVSDELKVVLEDFKTRHQSDKVVKIVSSVPVRIGDYNYYGAYLNLKQNDNLKHADKIILSDSEYSFWRFVLADNYKYYLMNNDVNMFVFSSKDENDPYVHLLNDTTENENEFVKIKWHLEYEARNDQEEYYFKNSYDNKYFCINREGDDKYAIISERTENNYYNCRFRIY